MPFEVRKISNYGCQHPVVARLHVQPHELVQWADLPHDKKGAVTTLYFELGNRLLKSHEVRVRLEAALQKSLDEYQPSANPRVKNVPHVIGLEGEAETFLYESKNYLRELLRILQIFFDARFDEASGFYNPREKGNSDLVEWATRQFGAADHFTTMLIVDQEWTGELIRKRNAVEHPGGRSGTLHVENITLSSDGKFILPRWHRDANGAVDLLSDMETLLDNLLTIAEDFLVSCIRHKTRHEIIQFVEIPAGDRNPSCPQRLTVQLDHLKLKPPIHPNPPA